MTWPFYTPDCIDAIATLLQNGGTLSAYRSNKSWGPPPKPESWTAKFERECERKFKVKHCVAVNSGTMALTAALKALDLPTGSEVVTTPYSFSATPASIILAGYKPVFADVDPTTFNITGETVKKALTRRTKAILVVDLFGGLADYTDLAKFGLPVIRDGCQSVGASRNGKYHFGAITCASGNGTKNCPVGEGGWALTDDAKLAEKMRLYISHAENFDKPWVGVNGRMPELTACVAFYGMRDLFPRNEHRRKLANILIQPQYAHRNLTRPCIVQRPEEHTYYVYPFLIKPTNRRSRKVFATKMGDAGIQVGEGYMNPSLEKLPAFRQYARKRLPTVTWLSRESLCFISCVTPVDTEGHTHMVARKIQESLS